MGQALIDRLPRDSEEMKYYLQEKLILDVTEHIVECMDREGINKTHLAQKLGRSKGYITQLLDGRANMTLRTLSDIMWALDCTLSVSTQPIDMDTQEVNCGYETTIETGQWPVSFSTRTDLRCRTIPTTQQQDTYRMAG
jgi:ribosome-binding protein aMBF1 (putative translation factor)